MSTTVMPRGRSLSGRLTSSVTNCVALRSACDKIRKLQTGSPGWAPVLVTDVADFAFFSRLNWLVEYVPSLSAPADGYFARKLSYLAWRYRDVPALPITADIGENMLLEDLLVD